MLALRRTLRVGVRACRVVLKGGRRSLQQVDEEDDLQSLSVAGSVSGDSVNNHSAECATLFDYVGLREATSDIFIVRHHKD